MSLSYQRMADIWEYQYHKHTLQGHRFLAEWCKENLDRINKMLEKEKNAEIASKN